MTENQKFMMLAAAVIQLNDYIMKNTNNIETAHIFNETTKRLLEEIEEVSPNVAQAIKEKMNR